MLSLIQKLAKQLSLPALAFAGGARSSPHDARVLDLFRNRIELKKSYNELQDELRRLRDRLKQQEGVTARSREALEALEQRLAEPRTAYPALVHYQLRALWVQTHESLRQFVAELRTQREALEREAQLREFARQQALRRQSATAACNEREHDASEASAEMLQCAQAVRAASAWWRYFKRRRLQRRLVAATQRSLATADDLAAARDVRDIIAAEPEPEFPGLTLATRRAVNMATVAHAQVLYERLTGTGLFELLRDAIYHPEIAADAYGDRSACEQLLADIGAARLLLQQQVRIKEDVQKCAQRLTALVRYDGEQDTVPEAGPLGAGPNGSSVLLEDAWNVRELLLA
jgi:hypothetical protein